MADSTNYEYLSVDVTSDQPRNSSEPLPPSEEFIASADVSLPHARIIDRLVFDINLGMPPTGYSLTAARAEETVKVQYLEFTSSEDGQHFVDRLEGFPNDVLDKVNLQALIRPSEVEQMLAIIRSDGTAKIFINEAVVLVATCRVSRPMEAGSAVRRSDIIDIDRIELNTKVADDAGIMLLFSVGWRKGLFYDFGPISGPQPSPRDYDLNSLLGQAYCYVSFQERFKISEDEWARLFQRKWFPFSGLRHETIQSIIAHVRAEWEPDDLLEAIVEEVTQRLPDMLISWTRHPSFEPHISILERAVERFQNRDYVSCTSLIYPRIEGILRTHQISVGGQYEMSSSGLSHAAVSSKISNDLCLLMPRKFGQYLREVYFANFNPNADKVDISRHSIAHGVADSSAFNEKSAVIGLLVLHQLFYFLEKNNSKT